MVTGYNSHTSAQHPKVFAIVLNYNGKETLKECLRSLFSSDYPNLEIVVVDNNSKDGSIEMVKAQFSRVHYIMLHKNIGFSSGNNQGIRFALEKQARYVFLLNNDARIESTTISRLVDSAKVTDNKAILSPIIYTAEEKSVWFCGGKIDWDHMRGVHISEEDAPKALTEVEYVSGCAMFIPRQIFKEIGLFDEKYFLYYEDVDLCVRAQKAGFSAQIEPEASAFHHEKSKENPDKLYWLVVSGVLFFTSRKTAKNIWRTKLYLLARKCKNALDILRKKDLQKALIIRKAFHDANEAKTFHHNSKL